MKTIALLFFESLLAASSAFYYPTDPATPLPFGIDVTSGLQSFPAASNFPFYGQMCSQFSVSQHATIALDEDFNTLGGVLPFAGGVGNTGKLIALFWVDHGAFGNDVSYYTSTDPALLTQAADAVATYFPCEAGFTPTYIVVATWNGVWPYGYHYGSYSYSYCYTYTYTYTSYSSWITSTYTYYTTWYTYPYCTYYPTHTSYCYWSSYYSTTYCTTTYTSTYDCTYYSYTYTYTYYYTWTTSSWWYNTYTSYYCTSTYYPGPENWYQLILASDAVRSFAILTYDSIEWSDAMGSPDAVAGFNKGDGVNSVSLPDSGTFNVINYDSTSNVGLPGMYMYRVDGVPTGDPCAHCYCRLEGLLTTNSGAEIDATGGISGKQKVMLAEENNSADDICRYRVEATIKMVDGNVKVKKVFFRFGTHNNIEKFGSKLTIKPDSANLDGDDIDLSLNFEHTDTDGAGTHIRFHRDAAMVFHMRSDTCHWHLEFDPVSDPQILIWEASGTGGLCGDCP